MKDLVHYVMKRASIKFGERDRFNAACFASAFGEITGVETLLDGKIVEAILYGRTDVKQLSGGSHYQLCT